jgi:hypothetical protein
MAIRYVIHSLNFVLRRSPYLYVCQLITATTLNTMTLFFRELT